MDRPRFSQLLRMLDGATYVHGSTQDHTYLVYLNGSIQRMPPANKRYVLKKISHKDQTCQTLYFDRCFEILSHLPCKTMSLQGANSMVAERSAQYLLH